MPECYRRERLILTLKLQAYFDDSGGKGQGRWMSLAGFFGDADQLAGISTQWREALASRYPGLPLHYFKMDEAVGYKGCFSFWSEENRDARVLALSKVIDRPDLMDITGLVDLEAHARIGARWAHFQREKIQQYSSMGEPYVMLAEWAITTAITEAVNRGATSPIEIIFDEQSRFAPTIIDSYMKFRAAETDPVRLAVMPLHPVFRDDKKFVLLQAADMIAGEIRLVVEKYPDNPAFIGTLCPNLAVSRFDECIDEARLEQIHEHTVRFIEEEERAANALHKKGGCED
jgi:Protein of unknown function (DUF3800)